MNPDIEKLIQLQNIETQIRYFVTKIEQLPRQLAAMEEKLQGTVTLLEQEKNNLQQIATDRRQLEGEIQVIEEKTSKYRSQLLEVKTNEQYKALLHEIDFQLERMRKIEDEILLSMEKEEQVRTEQHQLQQKHQKESAEVDQEQRVAQQEIEKTKANLAQRKQERQALRTLITPEVYEAYRKIAGVRKGVAVARATENCQGCHVRIRPSVLGQVMHGQQIVTCDRCGRILYWQEEAPYEQTS